VIANAGIVTSFPRVEEAQPADLIEHFRVNAVGVVVLFRAVLPLLKAGAKFIAMGTSAAMITEQERVNVPNAVYGPSKAALNWLMKKIHLENEGIVAFPIHPGWVLLFQILYARADLDSFRAALCKLRWGTKARRNSGWKRRKSRLMRV